MVALTSQLHPQAQRQASGQYGFDNTHTDILESEEVAAYIRARMEIVKNKFPPSHLLLLRQGGYEVALGEAYSPITQYMIRSMGKYVMALTNGTVTPIDPMQERFIAVVNGEKTPRDDAEKGWLRFISEHPEFKDDKLLNRLKH